jgi:hypothetical protein
MAWCLIKQWTSLMAWYLFKHRVTFRLTLPLMRKASNLIRDAVVVDELDRTNHCLLVPMNFWEFVPICVQYFRYEPYCEVKRC